MKDYYLFVKRFFSHPSITGSVFPSSKKLAERMTKQALNQKTAPLRYLEVGAGSGAMTKYLIPKLKLGDTLDIVEIDPHFCAQLRGKYGYLPHIKIYEASILDFEESRFDVVVSSLPLNAFKAAMVDQILLKYKNLVKPGGYVSYFEYIGLGRIKELYLSGKPQVDFKTILSLKKSFVKSYCTEIDRIWWNFPPARVFHCQM
jgi:phosphatidylethanolamine/phosphatidyl-N-methylethanolamine N-methyltransferase